MRPQAAAGRPGTPCRVLLPLALALLVDVGQAQRSPASRYELAARDASRLWRPAGSHPAAPKVYSLFREPDPPGPGSPPAERTQPAWGSAWRPAEAEAGRPLRAQQPRRAQPPAQTRRSGAPSPPQPAPRARTSQRPGAAPRGRLTGRNVCGGQCCPGWTTANSTSHCIKPVCQPPCQNRGSCSRPQLCVCRSGFRGARCEEVIPEEEFDPRNSRLAPRRSAARALSLRRSSPAREVPVARTQLPEPELPPARIPHPGFSPL